MCISAIVLIFSVTICRGGESSIIPVENGDSPNGKFRVGDVIVSSTNTEAFGDRHFEIRSSDDKTLASELDQHDLMQSWDDKEYVFWGASNVLWSKDSRWVAISTRMSKFSVVTTVFHWNGTGFVRVKIPDIESDSDNTFRQPSRWLKNGDLVLDITLGHQTKSEPGGHEYFITIKFSGDPLVGKERSRTKTTLVE